MKTRFYFSMLLFAAVFIFSAVPQYAEDPDSVFGSGEDLGSSEATGSDADSISTQDSKDNEASPTSSVPSKITSAHRKKSGGRKAEAFVAGPNWEFDGFVSGGQDQEIKSMFVVNDLLYLNIGLLDGIVSGDRLGIYRRGEKIRDPQTSRVLGYEVRKVAISEVTNRVDDNTCSARVMQSYEAIELGDLVRRED